MSHELLDDVYILYQKCRKTKDLNLLRHAIGTIGDLLNLFPKKKELLLLYLRVCILHKFISYKHNEHQRDIYDEFLRENDSFLLTIPSYSVRKQIITFQKFDNLLLAQIIDDFFMNLSSDLTLTFEQAKNERRILIRKPTIKGDLCRCHYKQETGFCNNIVNQKYFTYVNQFNTLSDACILVHEIGHYYYGLLNNQKEDDYYNPEMIIKREIPSRMMELLLIDYLKRIGYQDEAMKLQAKYNEHMIYHFYDNSYDTFICYTYLLGSYISTEYADLLINKQVSLEEFFQGIYETDYKDILQNTKEREYQKKLNRQ